MAAEDARYVREDAETRGEVIGLLTKAAGLLAGLTTKSAERGFSKRSHTIVGGYLTASEAILRTRALVEGINDYDNAPIVDREPGDETDFSEAYELGSYKARAVNDEFSRRV